MSFEIPTPRYLRTSGKFHSYILPGHYEVWRLGKFLYTIVDGVSKNSEGEFKHWEYVESLEQGKEQKYYAGFHPFDGEPCLKD